MKKIFLLIVFTIVLVTGCKSEDTELNSQKTVENTVSYSWNFDGGYFAQQIYEGFGYSYADSKYIGQRMYGEVDDEAIIVSVASENSKFVVKFIGIEGDTIEYDIEKSN